MDRRSRWSQILEFLAVVERLSVEEVAAKFGVSPATVRRDLDELAAQQLLIRTRGGAAVNGMAYDLPLRYKASQETAEKTRIAAAVAGLVGPGAVVGLNGGTTTTEVARALARAADQSDTRLGPSLTVVTNALNIACELVLHPRVKVVLTGGVARTQSYELVGPLTEGVLGQLTVDLTVLGVGALSVEHGAQCQSEDEARTNRLLAGCARSVVVATDSSKLTRHAFAQICPITDVDRVVTDAGATDAQVAALESAGPQVRRV